jgi:cation:H+ antiporter
MAVGMIIGTAVPTGVDLLVFAAAALVSLGASVVLVVRLERLGERLGFSEAMLGILAALAANAPEITSATTALVRGQSTVGAGVILGSNVFNLAALLGLSAMVAGRIHLHRRVILFAGTVALWLAALSLATARGLPPAAGLVLALCLFVPYVALSAMSLTTMVRLPLPWSAIRWLHWTIVEEESEISEAIRPEPGDRRDALEAAAALAVVVAASIAMEQSATVAGHRLGLSDIVVGGVVLAAVTSLPNAVAAVYLGLRRRGAAVLSEALNSNNLNVVLGLLLPTAILGLHAGGRSVTVSAAWYLAMTVLCLALAYAAKGLGRLQGVVVIAAYAAFVVVLARL